jgi:NADPH2:quinone reductase
MKAIRIHEFGGPEVLVLEDVSPPPVGPGQVLVRVHAVGVNPVDTYIRSGSYGPRDFPFTPGSDGAGVIEQVGEGVEDLEIGLRVYLAGSLSGSYAEKALCRADQVHPLPEKISWGQGAAVNVPYATAYRALFLRGGGKPGESVLIHGASGGVGVAALQLARAAGFKVFGTASSDDGLELVRAEGAHQAFNHRDVDMPAQLAAANHGHGVNLILEMLANVNLQKDLTMLAQGGRVVVIGSRGPIEINPRDTMARDADIRGMMLGHASPAELGAIHAALAAGLESGTLRPVVGQEFPLAEAAQAHRAVMESQARGKIVLLA